MVAGNLHIRFTLYKHSFKLPQCWPHFTTVDNSLTPDYARALRRTHICLVFAARLALHRHHHHLADSNRTMSDQKLFDALGPLEGIELNQILFSCRQDTIKLWWILSVYTPEDIQWCHRQRFPHLYQAGFPMAPHGSAYSHANAQARHSSGVSTKPSRPSSDTFSQPTDQSRSSTGTNYSMHSFNRQSYDTNYAPYSHRGSLVSINEYPNASTYTSQPRWTGTIPAQDGTGPPPELYGQPKNQAPSSKFPQQTGYFVDEHRPGWPLPDTGLPPASHQNQPLYQAQLSSQGNFVSAGQSSAAEISALPDVDFTNDIFTFPDMNYTQSPASMSPMLQHPVNPSYSTDPPSSTCVRPVPRFAVPNQKPFFCPFDCSRAFKSKGELKKHILADHEQSQSFKCKHPSCKKIFYRESEWKTHHSQGHSNCEIPDRTNCRDHIQDKTKQCWGCNLCEKLSFTLDDWAMHFEYHINHDKKSKEDCDYSVMIRSLLPQSSVRVQWQKHLEACDSLSAIVTYQWEQSTSSQLLHDLEYGVHQGVSLSVSGKAKELVQYAASLSTRRSKRPATSSPRTMQRMLDQAESGLTTNAANVLQDDDNATQLPHR